MLTYFPQNLSRILDPNIILKKIEFYHMLKELGLGFTIEMRLGILRGQILAFQWLCIFKVRCIF